jgi:hypothetical protein
MDYYNLAFLDNRRQVNIGIVFDASRVDSFSYPPDRRAPERPRGHGGALGAVARTLGGLCERVVR